MLPINSDSTGVGEDKFPLQRIGKWDELKNNWRGLAFVEGNDYRMEIGR